MSLWEARFLDMGKAQLLGEVEAPDEPTALRLARAQFARKRWRPAARIFVKRKPS